MLQDRAFKNLFRSPNMLEDVALTTRALERGDLKLRVRALEAERALNRVQVQYLSAARLLPLAGTLAHQTMRTEVFPDLPLKPGRAAEAEQRDSADCVPLAHASGSWLCQFTACMLCQGYAPVAYKWYCCIAQPVLPGLSLD